MVTNQDKEDVYFKDCETDRDIAAKKAMDWWASTYPESELHSIITHDAIYDAPKHYFLAYMKKREKKTIALALDSIDSVLLSESDNSSATYQKFAEVAYILDPVNQKWSTALGGK